MHSEVLVFYYCRLLFVFLFLASCSSIHPCPDIKIAAFDIGSGSTKLKVATKNSCTHQLTQEHFETSLPVAYADELSNSVHFSDTIAQRGEKAIGELLKEALVYKPDLIRGVATQAFRQAKNADDLIQRWNKKFGVSFKIIDQEKEAMLAYDLIAAKLQEKSYKRLVVWDIGGGSQQLISKMSGDEILIFKSQLASVTFKNMVIQNIKMTKLKSPNPLSSKEVTKAQSLASKEIDKTMNSEIRSILSGSLRVVGLGGVHGFSVKNQLGLEDGQRVELEQLQTLIKDKTGLNDEQLGGDYAQTQLTNLILVEALMKKYQIESYLPMSASLTEALIRLP